MWATIGVEFCSGFRWWLWQWVWVVVASGSGLGFAMDFNLFHNGFRWISVCFAMGFGG